MTDQPTSGAYLPSDECPDCGRSRQHEDDCPDRFQAAIWGNAVDGYEIGVVDEGIVMQGRVIRRYQGAIRTEREARRRAAEMLADERKRRATDIRERIVQTDPPEPAPRRRHCWLRFRRHVLGEWWDVPGVGTAANCLRCGRMIQTGSYSTPLGGVR